MKKISSVLLLILCMFTFFSCENANDGKAPAWLRGRTWSGNVTMSFMGESETNYITFEFNDDGELYMEDIPEGVSVITSGNSKSFQISMTGSYVEEGVSVDMNATLVFTKVSNSECKLSGSVKATTSDVAMNVILSGTLYRD